MHSLPRSKLKIVLSLEECPFTWPDYYPIKYTSGRRDPLEFSDPLELISDHEGLPESQIHTLQMKLNDILLPNT
jgi:hypothetical protein